MSDDSGVGRTGIIATFIKHPIGANLLVAILMIWGLYGLQKLNVKLLPDTSINYVIISVQWPNSSPQEANDNIINAIYPEVRAIEGVKDSNATAQRGGGGIQLQFEYGYDMQKAVNEVERVVKTINLPAGAEQPVIWSPTAFDSIASISISGPFGEQSLRYFAREIRDALNAVGIAKVEYDGYRDEEITVYVHPAMLQKFKLTTGDIAAIINKKTGNSSAGVVENQVNNRQIRVIGAGDNIKDISNIAIATNPDGSQLLLSEIARIKHRFVPDYKRAYVDGEPSLQLAVKMTTSSNVLKLQTLMHNTLEELRQSLPKSLKVVVYDENAEMVKDRVNMLMDNIILGLALVLIVLVIFLDISVAIWVALGIPVAMLAGFGAMELLGQSINMITLFALIMMLGIVVDDAIVVGEHTAHLHKSGMSPLTAVQKSVSNMFLPVVASSLTTAAAFLPVLMIQGIIGQIMSPLAVVATVVLVMSTIECFLVLPNHLRHSLSERHRPPSKLRQKFDAAFARFRSGIFKNIVITLIRWRYATCACCAAIIIIAFGVIDGGYISFQFFPTTDEREAKAEIIMQEGTRGDITLKAARKLEKHLQEVANKLSPDKPLLKFSYIQLGKIGSRGNSWLYGYDERYATINIELVASENRDVGSNEILAAFQSNIPDIAGVEDILIDESGGGPPGESVDIIVQSTDLGMITLAATELKNKLEDYANLTSVFSTSSTNKKELSLTLTPRGKALGFSSYDISNQLAGMFSGITARKMINNDGEIDIVVKSDFKDDQTTSLKGVNIKTPDNEYVPLLDVVNIKFKEAFTNIYSEKGKITALVTAKLKTTDITADQMVTKIFADVAPAIAKKYNVEINTGQSSKMSTDAFADLKLGTYIALLLIYIIIAWVFRNYFLPLVVMAIVPFGIIGSIIGHSLLGYNLSMISMFGLLGLTGILVNDSIILVSSYLSLIKQSYSVERAAVEAACNRLRAIILTTLTTLGGLIPLLFETSDQAQFLKPMAITIVFGLGFATSVVIFFIPVLIVVGNDITTGIKRLPGKLNRKVYDKIATKSGNMPTLKKLSRKR